MSEAFIDFEFDLPEALLQRLVLVFDGLGQAPLTSAGLVGIPDAQGVYQLFVDGELVYIGKTDSEAGLLGRLSKHAKTIQHRVGLETGRVTYRAVRIYVFTAIDLETQLIRHYRGKSGTAWNNSGFGANDPGRKRDHTQIKDTNFDAIYPIDIDRPLEVSFSDCVTAADALARLKAAVPYNLRFERAGRKKRAHEELEGARVNLLNPMNTARSLMVEVTRALPEGWQATALPGYLLLYKETDDKYPRGQILARS